MYNNDKEQISQANNEEKGENMTVNNEQKLKSYYETECSNLVFIGESTIDSNKNIKVYLYNLNNETELYNFRKLYQEYLFYYIYNHDFIDNMILPEDTLAISNYLVEKSKKVSTNQIVPQRTVDTSGIYGELFNDYYLRMVNKQFRFSTYIGKRNHSSGNKENLGFDLSMCEIKNNSLQVILSDAKFVSNIGSAKSGLLSDINVHLDLNYINKYSNIVLKKQAEAMPERNNEINKLINKINFQVEEKNQTFIEAINELNYSIKFIYFAIFQNEKDREVLKYKKKIEEIMNLFKTKISETEIKNYEIEVVFIPTLNTSMDLKNEMSNWT